jgi:hypothetical protein
MSSAFSFPNVTLFPPPGPPVMVSPMNRLGPNDSSISRGAREETGDNEARPTEKGWGDAQPTVDDTALGGGSSTGHRGGFSFDLEEEREDLDGIEIMEANDGRLGLTNTGQAPADDWAADTGETAVPDGEE